jgi:aspartate-semialdehyde dehydrogenase
VIGCTLVAALQPFSPSRIVILFFPPVSEQDQPGVDELESQTANLLSFRPFAQPVFDSQVAFNLLSSYGDAAAADLSHMRSQITDGIRGYLAGRMAVPAVQLIQAPVFYGYAFAAYAEFPSSQDPETIEAALVDAGVQIVPDEPPNNVTVAGQEQIQVARVLRDANVPAGVWISGVADNLRLAAYNAVRIAEELLVTPV